MTFPDLRPAFPHTAELTVNGQQTLQDVDFDPGCGYVSIAEARILWQCARDFPGLWVEVGSHTGFSGAHIAAAGADLLALDPSFKGYAFRRRATDNWTRAGVRHLIHDIPSTSGAYLPWMLETVAGAFVDGDHRHPAPLLDAAMLFPRLADRAVVVFHDCLGAPVEIAVRFLAERGLHTRVYDTMAGLAVCWRGDWSPPELQP